MKIVSLTAENFKRIRAVSINPEGNIVELTGDNAQGKSSILDAIWAAIDGKQGEPDSPIRAGEEVALIQVELGELKITRKFINRDGIKFTKTLTVENADGHKLSPPQEILDNLTCALTFDPLEFSRQDQKKQIKTLRELVPGFDFDAADAEISRLEEYRRDKGREHKAAIAAANAFEVPVSAPDKEVDTSDIIEQLEQSARLNDERARERRRREDVEKSVADALQQKDDLLEQIQVLQQKAEEIRDFAAREEAELQALPPVEADINVAELRQKLTEAEQQNKLFAQVNEKAKLDTIAETKESAWKAVDDEIKARREEVDSAVRSASLPVDGLSFDANGVTLNGIPYSQASHAEQLRTAVAVAVALNPKLRVLRVQDGALLGTQAMKDLTAFADEFDMQIWIETVESRRPGAIVIEDGSVVDAAE